MNFGFPSMDFDAAVAAVCHGSLSDAQALALNELLRRDPAARDEYILRVELHSRLASDPDLFASAASEVVPPDDFHARSQKIVPIQSSPARRRPVIGWAVALAACVALAVS